MRSLRSHFVPSALLLLAFMALTGAATGSQPRPFTVIVEGHANPVFVDNCIIQNTESGTGHASHMGTITWSTTETIDTCASPDVALVDGQLRLVGANGDEVTGTYRTVVRLDFATSEVMAAGLYRITGGTGAFVNASGNGVITAEGSLLPPFEVVGDLSGTISFHF